MNSVHVFGYLRVSGKSQVDGDGPERQKQAISKFCEAHKLTLSGEWFFEPAVSGTSDSMDRPVFARLIGELERLIAIGEKVAICVERVDRLARDLMVSELLFRECRARGIQVFAADRGTMEDLSSEDGDPTQTLIRQFMGALAQWEKTNLVRKLRAARQRVREATGRCEGPVAYGESEEESSIKHHIVELQANSGLSYAEIAERLNIQKLFKRGEQWTRHSVYQIVKPRPNQKKGKKNERK
jgi:DNA invertase Pin-like site-specific DNA recombinase